MMSTKQFTQKEIDARAQRRARARIEFAAYKAKEAAEQAIIEEARKNRPRFTPSIENEFEWSDARDEIILMSREALESDRLGVDLARERARQENIAERARQENIASARRLALGMALHSRLGENSWLSHVADIVPLLAKQI